MDHHSPFDLALRFGECVGPARSVELDGNFTYAEPTVSKQEVKERQKDVIPDTGHIMMAHVISTSETETGRQPSVHVNSPVDFFGRDQVDSPPNENAGADSQA